MGRPITGQDTLDIAHYVDDPELLERLHGRDDALTPEDWILALVDELGDVCAVATAHRVSRDLADAVVELIVSDRR